MSNAVNATNTNSSSISVINTDGVSASRKSSVSDEAAENPEEINTCAVASKGIYNDIYKATDAGSSKDSKSHMQSQKSTESNDLKGEAGATVACESDWTSPVKSVNRGVASSGSSVSGAANPPLSLAKKATKFEIISVQEVENDEVDDGEESGEDVEDSVTELNSNQSRGSFSNEEYSKEAPLSQTVTNLLVAKDAPMVGGQSNDNGNNESTLLDSKMPMKDGNKASISNAPYSRTNSEELAANGHTVLSSTTLSRMQPKVVSNKRALENNISSIAPHGQLVVSEAYCSQGSPPNGIADDGAVGVPINQTQSNVALNTNPNSSTLSASVSHHPHSNVLPSRFRVVKKVKPYHGKRGRWDCNDVPSDVIMRSTNSNAVPANSNHPTIIAAHANLAGGVSPEHQQQQMYNSNAALTRVMCQHVNSNNASFASAEDMSGSNKNPIHVPLVSHVTSSGNSQKGNLQENQIGFHPIASLDEALSNAVTGDAISERKQSLPNWESGGTLANGDVSASKNHAAIFAAVATRCGSSRSDEDSGGSSEAGARGALDDVTRKLEQVMEVVKSHVVMTVQEEFEMVKSELENIKARNIQLEKENSFLRQQQHGNSKKRDASIQVNSSTMTANQESIASNIKNEEATSSGVEKLATVRPSSSSPAVSMPYVVLGIGNASSSNIALNYHTNHNEFQPVFQRPTQLQSLGYYPMSFMQNAPTITHALPGASHHQKLSTSSEDQNHGLNGMLTLEASGTTNAQQLQTSYSKGGSDSGRSSLEPTKERNQSFDSASQQSMANDSTINGNQQLLQYQSLNFAQQPSTKSNLISGANQNIGTSSNAYASVQNMVQIQSNSDASSSASDQTHMLQQQQQQTLSVIPAQQVSQSQQQQFAAAFQHSHLNTIAGGLMPVQQVQPQQQLFYMPQVALQPIQQSHGFSFSMVPQMQNHSALYLPQSNMVAHATGTAAPPQQQVAGNPYAHQFVNTAGLNFYNGNSPAMYFPQNSAQHNTAYVACTSNAQPTVLTASNGGAISQMAMNGSDMQHAAAVQPIQGQVVVTASESNPNRQSSNGGGGGACASQSLPSAAQCLAQQLFRGNIPPASQNMNS